MIKCAFYEKEITPPLGCSIPGYFNVRLGCDVLDRLYAKSVVFKSNDKVYSIITVDGCHVPKPLYKRVVRRVEKFTGIKKENITFACVHSHTGLPEFYENPDDITPEAREAEEGFLEVVSKLIADCVTLAFYRLEESKLSFGMGEEKTVTRCRDYRMKNGDIKTNPTPLDPNIIGPMYEADYDIPVLFVRDINDKPMGAVITYSCHLDCVGGEKYSGDYASVLSKELKKHFGEEFVTIFMMSAGGNMNDYYVDRVDVPADIYIKYGKSIAAEALKVIANSTDLVGEEIEVSYKDIVIDRTEIPEEKIAHAQHIVKTLKMVEGVKLAADGTDPEQFELAMAKELLATLEKPESFNVPLQVVKIGDFAFFALPNEVYAQFAIIIKEKSPAKKNMVATLCNASYGYVPTKEAFDYNGIYPTRIGINMLAHNAGDIMVDNVLEMAGKLF